MSAEEENLNLKRTYSGLVLVFVHTINNVHIIVFIKMFALFANF